MRRAYLIVCAIVLLCAVLSAAHAQQIISGPYVRWCAGNVHAWVYTQSASGVVAAPGPSCPASAACLSPTQIAAQAYAIMTAADPVAAAASANNAAVAFECTAAVRAGTDWRAALCKERRQFIEANIKAATGFDPVDGPTQEPSCTPPPKVWKVKANGLLTTRPAYTLAAGIRGTKEVARATVGAACDTTHPTLASSADLWAEFDATKPGVVALCTTN